MRGVTLTTLVDRLRADVGHSLNAAHGQQVEDHLKRALRRAQTLLWEELEWQHLMVYRTILPQAGQRYYAVPSDLPFEKITAAWVRYASRWVPLDYGIEPEDFTVHDSEAGERFWPVYKWDTAEDAAETAGTIDAFGMIELWPIPSITVAAEATEGKVMLYGKRTIKDLTANTDRCSLDSEAILARAAAEVMDDDDRRAEARLLARQIAGQGTKADGFSFAAKEKSWRSPNFPPMPVNRNR